MPLSKNLYTVIGLSAILMWSTLVGLIRLISERIDPVTSVTLLYSLSTLILLILFKIPKLNKIPKQYLLLATLLFVSYELCFSFSITLANNSQQAIEVGVLNHLWPSLTILLMVVFKEIKFHALLILGLSSAFFGIIYIQTNGLNISFHQVMRNLIDNPLPYILALAAAFIWAFYCLLLKKMSNGENIIAFLFLMTSITLWIKSLFFSGFNFPPLDLTTWSYLIVAALFLGLGYAAWNIGMVYGNMNVLISSSYFIPVISAFFSALLFGISLKTSFWLGTFLVVFGSILCWISTSIHSFSLLKSQKRTGRRTLKLK